MGWAGREEQGDFFLFFCFFGLLLISDVLWTKLITSPTLGKHVGKDVGKNVSLSYKPSQWVFKTGFHHVPRLSSSL